MPDVTWGEYSFYELTPHQKYLATRYLAEEKYKLWMAEAKYRDWERAVEQIRTQTKNSQRPKDAETKPLARANITLMKYLDGERAVEQIKTETHEWPKDAEIRPLAQANYEKRVALITEEMRKKAEMRDWLTAEDELTHGRRAYLPVEHVPQLKARWLCIHAG